MFAALQRVPKHKRRATAQEWARRSNAVQAQQRMECGVDADTLRARALDGARGQLIAEGIDDTGNGPRTHWRIVRSRRGRTNQVDLEIDGSPWLTGSRRDIERWARS